MRSTLRGARHAWNLSTSAQPAASRRACSSLRPTLDDVARSPRRLPLLLAIAALMLAGCTRTHVTAAAHKPLPSATPSPSARPAPARRYFWPLTGLPAAAAASTTPALSIKFDNAPDARPQSGLDKADIVFECLVE